MSTARIIDAVLYDHDGTLVDSLSVVVLATNAALRLRGLPEQPPATIIAAMVLPTAPRMGFHAGIADDDVQRAMAKDFYDAAIGHAASAVAYAGVPAVLNAVAQRGLGQGVISNNQGLFVRAALAHLGLSPCFPVPGTVLGEEDMPAPKPSPSGLLLAAQRLAVDPVRCAYVGDSPGDAQAAHAAGMLAIGVTWGIHPRAEMLTMGFDHLIDTPQELLGLLSHLQPHPVR